MNLYTRIKTAIFGPPPLRNVAGGMAWIKNFGADYGADALAGRVVKTCFVAQNGLWAIDPPQSFTVSSNCVISGVVCFAGERFQCWALADEFLQPMDAPGEDAKDESQSFYPPVSRDLPARIKEQA